MKTHTLESVDFHVLRALARLDSGGQPPVLSPRELVAEALSAFPGLRPQITYSSINRLIGRKFIEAGEPKRYQITAQGLAHFRRLVVLDPWRPNSLLTGLKATYRLGDKLFKRGSVQVFLARVHRTTDPRGLLYAQATVVIKVIDPAPYFRMPFSRSVANEIARYIRLTNEAIDAELPGLRAIGDVKTIAATLDSGDRPLLIDAGHEYMFIRQRFIVQTYVNGQELETYLRGTSGGTLGDRAGGAFKGVSTTAEWFELATQLAEHLRTVHELGSFHRRLSPKTILAQPSRENQTRFVCVDLAEAALSAVRQPPLSDDPAFEAPPDSDLDHIQFVAPEQRRDRIFPSRQADLFSAGALLYYALTGAPPRYADVADHEALKAAIAAELWKTVAKRNIGIADIVSRCLRVQPDSRVPSAYALVQDIQTFARLHASAKASVRIRHLAEQLDDLTRHETTDVFGSFATLEALQFMEVLKQLRSGSVTVFGDRDQIVWRLCSYLSTLGMGDEYWTVTVPTFWRPTNVGVRGRYLSMNLEIARYGARIKRLFVLTPEETRSTDSRDVIMAHLELQRRFERLRTEGGEGSQEWGGSIETRFVRMSEEHRRRAVADGAHRGLWIRAESVISLTPLYGREGDIRSVNVKRLSDFRSQVEESFLRQFERGTPLEEWEAQPWTESSLITSLDHEASQSS